MHSYQIFTLINSKTRDWRERMSGSAYSFTRKIIFLGRIVSPCTYTSFCRAITFDNQPWLFAWKRAASVSVSRVNSLYNPCDEFLVGFFPPSPVSVVFEQLLPCIGVSATCTAASTQFHAKNCQMFTFAAVALLQRWTSLYRSCNIEAVYIYIYI